MTSVITGDIINSRKVKPELWLPTLKNTLNKVSNNSWDVYRGDSFQVEVTNYYESFISAVYIKAALKTIKGIDVRLAIGIGGKTFIGNSVSESSGEVFIMSGSTLEQLKSEKTNLKIKSTNSAIDKELNLFFRFALIAMDNWTVNSAEVVKLFLDNLDKTQSEISDIIGISQDAVSKRLKRSHLDEILQLDLLFRQKIEA
jgi:predicted XRE-type DNA-binding protein